MITVYVLGGLVLYLLMLSTINNTNKTIASLQRQAESLEYKITKLRYRGASLQHQVTKLQHQVRDQSKRKGEKNALDA